MIDFKYQGLDDELRNVHKDLYLVLTVLAHLGWLLCGERARVTSIFRDDGGIHNYWRAIDVGVFQGLSMDENERIRKCINALFPYGDGRHETCPPLQHGTAPHFHLQVREG